MGWYLYDSDGYVGDLASGKGLAYLRTFSLDSNTSPVVKAFFKKGYSKSTSALQSEFKLLCSPDPTVNETIQNLVELLGKCKNIAIISNGVK